MSKYQLFRVVTAAVIEDNGKFLLGRRHPKDDNLPDFWSIPAGHIEVEETDINTLEENLKREVKEELGIEIEVGDYLDSHSWVTEEYSKLTVVFLARITSGEPQTSEEISEVKWYTVEEASSLNLPPNVLRVLEKAALNQRGTE